MVATYHYCCNNQLELGNNGYIDGTRLFLQRLNVDTNLPANLRHHQFCVTCGQANIGHPTDDVLECITLRNAVLKNQFRQTGNEFAFNLNTLQEYSRFQAGDQNYPSPIELKYCPYCSREYLAPTFSY